MPKGPQEPFLTTNQKRLWKSILQLPNLRHVDLTFQQMNAELALEALEILFLSTKNYKAPIP